jgi:hypothetical protein
VRDAVMLEGNGQFHHSPQITMRNSPISTGLPAGS